MSNPLSGDSSGVVPGVTGIGSGAVGVFGSSDSINGVVGWGTTTGNGVEGKASQSGSGVSGASQSGSGVSGTSQSGAGVSGTSQSGYGVHGSSNKTDGVYGVNGLGSGIPPGAGSGVRGDSDYGFGVYAASKTDNGVHAVSASATSAAVYAESTGGGPGVSGVSSGAGAGVEGKSQSGYGVHGSSSKNDGVYGVNGLGSGIPPGAGCGVRGDSDNGFGVYAASKTADGVHAVTASALSAAVYAESTGGGPGIIGKSSGQAGRFEGDVHVTGTLTATDVKLSHGAADCAEDFDVHASEKIDPGTVVVFDSVGALTATDRPYDKRVAGVISGAGYRSALILDHCAESDTRAPLALIGKVYCKVDATFASIEVGDLLTTSPTPGHAMKAQDPLKSFGAVIGKAIAGLEHGRGLIPILVALQ